MTAQLQRRNAHDESDDAIEDDARKNAEPDTVPEVNGQNSRGVRPECEESRLTDRYLPCIAQQEGQPDTDDGEDSRKVHHSQIVRTGDDQREDDNYDGKNDQGDEITTPHILPLQTCDRHSRHCQARVEEPHSNHGEMSSEFLKPGRFCAPEQAARFVKEDGQQNDQ